MRTNATPVLRQNKTNKQEGLNKNAFFENTKILAYKTPQKWFNKQFLM